MEYCKLQLGCMVLVVYIALCHLRTHRRTGHRADLYDLILGLGMLELVFDALSAWTVNHLDTVPPVLNLAVHLVFLMLIDAVIFGAFLYIWLLMYGLPRRTWQRLALAAPFVINELVLVCAIPTLTYQSGRISNYSDGVSATTCFVMALVYVLFALLLLIRSGRRLEERKRAMFMLYLVAVASVSLFQMLNRDALVSSLGTTILILGMYINLEDPLIEELESAHREMVVGYATLVERRDGSTGAHIKRTSRYVQLMADALVERRCYRDQMTRDVLRSLVMAAPMHDIGKISVPDTILCKPGRLTKEEFEVMKRHTTNGGEIIREIFSSGSNGEFAQMAFDIAMYHHEKWDGSGYPSGLKGQEIPLPARIMAIADVFDAVSENRCYRAAMPLEQCFDIIREGRGTAFEPLLVDVFLDIRPKIEEAHRQEERAALQLARMPSEQETA